MKLATATSFILLSILPFFNHAQCIQSISAGYSHSIALKPDGTLWSWGFNGSGQLGDGTNIEKLSPVKVGSGSDWKKISAGGFHNLALRENGTLWAWGYNLWGQVGDGSYGNTKSIPMRIGLSSDWKSISAGKEFSAAIKNDGSLWTWGDNFYGQLGLSSPAFIPTQVGTSTNWKQVAAGGYHVLAVQNDGTLWAWGYNRNYQLGDGTAIDKNAPTKIGTATDWSHVIAGEDFSAAIKTDGTLWTWGKNDKGQLGNGTYLPILSPTKLGNDTWQSVTTGGDHIKAIRTDGTLWTWGFIIGRYDHGTGNTNSVPTRIGANNNWSSVSAGYRHAFAVSTEGKVWAWGEGTWGKLGLDDGYVDVFEPTLLTPANPLVPTSQLFCKASTLSELEPINMLWYSTAAGGSELSKDTPLIDGAKFYGSSFVLGCESESRIEVLVIVREPTPPPIGETIQSICPGATLAQTKVSGASLVWYYSSTDQTPLWDGFPVEDGARYFATQTIDGCVSSRVEYIFKHSTPPPPTGSSQQSFCKGAKLSALQATGTNITWYQPNIYSGPIKEEIYLESEKHFYATQTIDGCESKSKLDVFVTLTPNHIASVQPITPITGEQIVYNGFSGVIDKESRLWGWGWNGTGLLANGTLYSSLSPVLVHEGPWKEIVTEGNTITGIKTNGTMWAWGSNLDYALGVGSGVQYDLKNIIQIGDRNDWMTAARTSSTGAALTTDGALWTWGKSYYRGTEYWNWPAEPAPKQVGNRIWEQIVGGVGFFLALKDNGLLSSWGTNTYGELGNGSNEDKILPTWTETSGWKELSASYQVAGGIKTDGSLWTWGSNERGCLGIPGLPRTNTPQRVGNSNNWKLISVGFDHCLAIRNDGTLWAWGSNNYYQLGDGTNATRLSPVQIGTDTDWKDVSSVWNSSIALKNDGSIWTWGRNVDGQLGTGTTININSPTKLQVGYQFACPGATVADIAVEGTNLQWYETTTNILPMDDSSSLINGKTYYATQTVDGCESQVRTSVYVINKEMTLPSPEVPSAQNHCEGSTIEDLTAEDTNITWYASSVGGTILVNDVPLESGHHYFAERNIAACKSHRAEVVVTLTPNTTSTPIGASIQEFCDGATVMELAAIGTGIYWYESADSRSPLDPSRPLEDGKHYFAGEISSVCSSDIRLDVLAKIKKVNSPEALTNQVLCEGSIIGDIKIEGNDIYWYADTTSTQALLVSTLLIDNTTYYASQILGNCESQERTSVRVNLSPIPSAPQAESVQSFAIGKILADIEISGSDIIWYGTLHDALNQINSLPASTIMENGVTYYATQTVSECESTPIPVTIDLVTGIEQGSESFVIHPNPVKKNLNICSEGRILHITIATTTNQVVFERDINVEQTTIDVNHLASGIYIVQVRTETGVYLTRLLKQ